MYKQHLFFTPPTDEFSQWKQPSSHHLGNLKCNSATAVVSSKSIDIFHPWSGIIGAKMVMQPCVCRNTFLSLRNHFVSTSENTVFWQEHLSNNSCEMEIDCLNSTSWNSGLMTLFNRWKCILTAADQKIISWSIESIKSRFKKIYRSGFLHTCS